MTRDCRTRILSRFTRRPHDVHCFRALLLQRLHSYRIHPMASATGVNSNTAVIRTPRCNLVANGPYKPTLFEKVDFQPTRLISVHFYFSLERGQITLESERAVAELLYRYIANRAGLKAKGMMGASNDCSNRRVLESSVTFVEDRRPRRPLSMPSVSKMMPPVSRFR